MLNKALKTLSTTFTIIGLVLIASNAYAVGEFEVPTGGQVVGGSATFSNPAQGVLNITQQTDRTVINWDTFNVGAQATTEFIQPSASAMAVNRITSSGVDGSQILGSLKSNGRVMILDRNGVFFGQNARIDVGSIIAATGDVDNAAIMRGDNRFDITNFGNGKIVNKGLINVADAGIAAFVSPMVANSGIINAKLGKVGMGAGSKVTLDLYGDNLMEIAVNDKTAHALLENSGTINAQGGTVMMTAQAAKDAVDSVINMNGVVNATSFSQQGGKIVLSGGKQGTVNVGGKMDVSGENKGNISVTGQNIYLDNNAYLFANGGVNGHAGDVIIIADNATLFRGNIYAQGGTQSGNGGFVEVSGLGWLGFKGHVNTLAANGIDGMLYLDPADIVIASGSGDGASDGTATFRGASTAGTVAAANAGPTTIYESELEGIGATTNISVAATNSIVFNNLADNTLSLQQTSPRTVTFTAGAGGITMQDTNDTILTATGAMTFTTTGGGSITLGNLANTTGAMTFNTTGGGGVTLGNLVKTSGLVTVNTSGSSEITGIISGAGTGLTKTGTGTLKLSGINSYSGVTTVTGGTLSVSSIGNGLVAGNLGQAAGTTGNLVLGGGTTLEYTGTGEATDRNISLSATATVSVTNAAAELIMNGIFSGTTAGLNKNGAGTLTMAAASPYTGTTTINGGTLKYAINNAINGTAQGAIVVNDGATLDLNNHSDTITTLTVNSGVTGGLVKTGTGTLTLGGNITSTGGANNASIQGNLLMSANRTITTTNAADGLAVAANISGAFTLTKAGAGTLTLSGTNTHSATTINNGTILLGASGALGASTANITVNASGANQTALLDLNGFNQTINNLTYGGTGGTSTSVNSVTTGTGVLTLGGNLAYTVTGNPQTSASLAGNLELTSTPSHTFTINNSSNADIDFVISAALTGTGTLSKAGTGTLAFTGNSPAFAGTVSIGAGVVEIGNNNVFGTTGIVNLAGGTIRADGAGRTLNNSVNLTASSTVNGSSDFTFGGLFTNAGAFTLTNNNTSVVNFGDIALANTTTNRVLIFSGTGLTNVNGTIGNGASTASGLTKSGTGTLALYGNNTYSGTFTVNAGSVELESNGALSATGALTVPGGIIDICNQLVTTGTVTLSGGEITGMSGTLTGTSYALQSGILSATLAGTAAANKTTSGTVTVSSDNWAYLGTTTLSAGTLVVANDNAFGGGTFALSGGTLRGDGTPRTIANAVTLSGSALIGGSSALDFTGHMTNTATNALTINNTGATTFNTIALANTTTNRTLSFGGTGNLTINGLISNGLSTASNLTKTGTGTLTLANATNTYSGVTTVNGGVLSVNNIANGSAASSIGASSNVATNLILNNGTLRYTGASTSTNRNYTITTGATGTIDVANAGTTLTLTGGSANTTGALRKVGDGTLTLSGVHQHAGLTTVAAGTMSTSNSNRISDSSTVIVDAGATLNLNGGSELISAITSNGTVNIASGGDLITMTTQTYNGVITGHNILLNATSLTANNQNNDFTGTLRLNVSGGAVSIVDANDLTLGQSFVSTINARANGGNLTLANALQASSNSANAVILSASANFINNAGASAINMTGGGNWKVYSTDPALDTLGSLTSNYRRFSCTFSGSCPTLGTGNGLLYSVTPVLTATAINTSVIYGNALDLNGYAYNLAGYLDSDAGADIVTGALNGTSAYTQTSNVGSYNIDHASGALASEMGYGFVYANSANALTVQARGLTITADTQTKTYGAADPALTYATNSGANVGLVNGDTLSGALTRANLGTLAGEQVGNYAITQGTLAASSNYALTFTGNVLGITTKALTVTADNLSKTYGSLDPALTYTSSGLLNGTVVNGVTLTDSITGTLARLAGENVNGYAINQGTLTASSNYALSYTPGLFTVLGKQLTLLGLTANHKPYDGTAGTTLDTSGISFSGLNAGDDVTLVGGTATFADFNIGAGKTVNISGLSLGGAQSSNYLLLFPVTLTADITAPTAFTQTNVAYNIPNISPPTSGLKSSGTPTPTATQLAQIQPAAGGTSAEAMANIEPAAGGSDPTEENSDACWQAAAAGAGISFGAAMGDTLASVDCQ